MIVNEGKDEAMRNMIDPVRWRLASPVGMIKEKGTTTADTVETIEMNQDPVGRCTSLGLESSGSMTRHQTRSSTDLATCISISTPTGRDSPTISRRIVELSFGCRELLVRFRARRKIEGSLGCLDSLNSTLLLHHHYPRIHP
jgi:hypothetical protein